jgi:hypothetical protein
VNYCEQAEEEKNVDQEKNAHKEPDPRNVDIFCIRNLLPDDLLIFHPFPVDPVLVRGELNNDNDPENCKW